MPWRGLGRGGLGCSCEVQEGNKDREGKKCRKLEKGAGMRTAYHNLVLIISCLENTASSAGWSTVLLGYLLQVEPGGQGSCFSAATEGGVMWLMASPTSSGSGGPC